MSWIASHSSTLNHPKTQRLARVLNVSVPTAVGYLHGLWWFGIEYAQDGELSKYDTLDIAIGSMWEGDPDAFLGALVACRFVDRTESGKLMIHDWEEYGGKLIESREKNARRMRSTRAKNDGTSGTREEHVPDTSGVIDEHENARAANVSCTFAARAVLEKSREENRTEEEKRGEVPPAAANAGEPAPPPPVPITEAKQRARRLPVTFALSAKLRQWAKDEFGLDDATIDYETEKFRDHWGAKTEAKTDWAMAWRNWIRGSVERGTGPPRALSRTRSTLPPNAATHDSTKPTDWLGHYAQEGAKP